MTFPYSAPAPSGYKSYFISVQKPDPNDPESLLVGFNATLAEGQVLPDLFIEDLCAAGYRVFVTVDQAYEQTLDTGTPSMV